MNYMLEFDYSCGRGPDPVGDKSGRGPKGPQEPLLGIKGRTSELEALAGKL